MWPIHISLFLAFAINEHIYMDNGQYMFNLSTLEIHMANLAFFYNFGTQLATSICMYSRGEVIYMEKSQVSCHASGLRPIFV